MTVLMQTRVPKALALRFKSAARSNGKSAYRVLRELAEEYAGQNTAKKFASEKYPDRFGLPEASKFKTELRRRMRQRHAEHY